MDPDPSKTTLSPDRRGDVAGGAFDGPSEGGSGEAIPAGAVAGAYVILRMLGRAMTGDVPLLIVGWLFRKVGGRTSGLPMLGALAVCEIAAVLERRKRATVVAGINFMSMLLA